MNTRLIQNGFKSGFVLLLGVLVVGLAACGGGSANDAAAGPADPAAQTQHSVSGAASKSSLIVRDFSADQGPASRKQALAVPPVPLPSDTVTLSVVPGVKTFVRAYAFINPFTCEYIESGTFSQTVAATNGDVEFTQEMVTYGGNCPGPYMSGVARYTWRPTTPPAPAGSSDFFSLRFVTTSGGASADSNWLAVVKPPVAVRILFDGVDVTDPKPTRPLVYVGQRIDLVAVPDVIDPPLTAQEWLVNGAVGGFTDTLTRGEKLAIDDTKSTVSFHWVRPISTTSKTVKVEYMANYPDGSKSSATASFDLQGPDLQGVTPVYGKPQVQLDPNNKNTLWWSFGTLPRPYLVTSPPPGPGSAGIYVPSPIASKPAAVAGTIVWKQVIAGDQFAQVVQKGTKGASSGSCSAPANALDTYLVAPTKDAADGFWDTVYFDPTYAKNVLSLDRVFSARAHAMWSSGLPGSIPVPLGYSDWGFEMHTVAVKKKAACDPLAIGFCTTSAIDPATPIFTLSADFPYWETLSSGDILVRNCN